jgi:dGTPase
MIDLTDEIAYSTADLDDGVEAMILTREQIRESVPLFADMHAEVVRLYPDAPEKLQFNEALKRLLDCLVSDLISNSRKLISASGAQSVDDVRQFHRRLLDFSPGVEEERGRLRDFLHRNLYFSEDLRPEKEQAELVITELFDFFMRSREALPSSYQEKLLHEPLYRVTCDYIAGMTDNFVSDQHRRFCAAPRRARVSS